LPVVWLSRERVFLKKEFFKKTAQFNDVTPLQAKEKLLEVIAGSLVK
jgi:hypothetical protein